MDLKAANLEGANLDGVDLRGAELCFREYNMYTADPAILDDASLRAADLREAELGMVRLERACLEEANLERANFDGAFLCGADLTKANLQEADFSGADLSSAILRKANLRYGRFAGAGLSHAILSGANLQNANLTEACLSHAELHGAIVTGATMYRASLAHVDLGEICLGDHNVQYANFTNANLTRATWFRANLRGANLSGQKLSGTDLSDVCLSEANLEGVDLSGANLTRARMEGTRLRGAVLTKAKLRYAVLQDSDLAYSDLSGADLRGACLLGCDLSHSVLCESNLEQARLERVDFRAANLSGANLRQASLARARIDVRSYMASGWKPSSIRVIVAAGAIVVDPLAFPADALMAAAGEREGLTLFFNTRLTRVDRLLVEIVIAGSVSKSSDCCVAEYREEGESAVVRIEATEMSDLRLVGEALSQRVWEDMRRDVAHLQERKLLCTIAPQLSQLAARLERMTLVPRRLRFEELSGRRFEELVGRYLMATGWKAVEHSGRSGRDSGWDLAAIDQQGKVTCFACANHRKIRFGKPKSDIDRLLESRRGPPDRLVYVSGCEVTEALRARIREYAKASGLDEVDVWSSTDLECRLKERAPSVVMEFFGPVLRYHRKLVKTIEAAPHARLARDGSPEIDES